MKGKICLVLASLCLLTSLVQAASPEGNWTAVDEKSGKKRAVINIHVSGSTLVGTVVETFPDPGEEKICINCPGAFKYKPIKGLQIVWGMKDRGDGTWDDGKILDPKSGKIYRAKMSLDGSKLHVRGYLGISMIGRSQIWER